MDLLFVEDLMDEEIFRIKKDAVRAKDLFVYAKDRYD